MKQRKDFFERMELALKEKKNELLIEVNSLNEKKPEKQDVGDIGDEALASEMDKVQNSLLSAELQEVAQIDFALNLLHQGEYGLCQDCSEEISMQRLEHYPYAQRCIGCQEVYEKRGK